MSEDKLEKAEKVIRRYLSKQPEHTRWIPKFGAIDLVAMELGLINRKAAIQYVDTLIRIGKVGFDGWNIKADV